jgi:3-oxoacyl-[acyl-carrier protein] reductase
LPLCLPTISRNHAPMNATSPLPLAGKAALVTGGSRGIGAGIVRELAAQGARVAFTYQASADRAEALIDDVRAAGGTALAIVADNSSPASAQSTVREAAAALGGLDILVNNAGTGWFEPFADAADEHIEDTINLNIRGTMYSTRQALQFLPDGGRIITIGSITGHRTPFPGGATYGMSKAALIGFTQGIARDLGPRGITANVVQPGPIDTDGNPAAGPGAAAHAGYTALNRFGAPADVAGLVAWIASDAAAFMTGSTVNIDGGWAA